MTEEIEPDPPDFDALWDHADPAATEARFRALLPEFERVAASGKVSGAPSGTRSDPSSESPSGAPSRVRRSAHLQLLTQLARTKSLQRAFDEAHRILDTVEPQLEDADDVTRVRYLLERGRALNSSGRPGDARPLFVDAFDRARACGADGFAVDAAHMVAIVEPPDGALAWNERALTLAETSPDPAARRWRASLYNNLGWTYHAMGNDARALDVFERAVPLREAAGNAATIRIARWSVARILRAIADIDRPQSPAGEGRRRFVADLIGYGPAVINAYRSRILATTTDDIRRVAATWLDPDRAAAAVVTSRDALTTSGLGWESEAIGQRGAALLAEMGDEDEDDPDEA